MTWLLQQLYKKTTSILPLQFVHIENTGTRESFSFPQIHIMLSRTVSPTNSCWTPKPPRFQNGTVFEERLLYNEVLRWAIIQTWLVSLQKTRTEGRPCEDTEESHLQAKEKGLKRNQPCWQLDLRIYPPELWGNKFLLLSHRISGTVMAALASKYSHFPNNSIKWPKPGIGAGTKNDFYKEF